MKLKQLFLKELFSVEQKQKRRHGAGILFLASDTGRVLLSLRSSAVSEPHTWGVIGGKIEDNESPLRAARREVKEEISFTGKFEHLIPAYVFKTKDFKYYNFVGVVLNEFTPVLDYENDDAQWFDMHELPEPLHFGAMRLFQNARHVIEKHLTRNESMLLNYETPNFTKAAS